MTAYKWSTTAADNDDADSTINLRENQSPSTYNNAVRNVMAGMAKYMADVSGNLATGGSSTAYTVTSNQVFASLIDGISVRVRMHATNGATPTFAPDGLTAKAIQMVSGTAVPQGILIVGSIHTLTYDSSADAWIVDGAAGFVTTPIGSIADFGGTSAPTGWLLCYGQAVSRTDYAALFAVLSTTYGVGDGSSTFNLPDLRGRVVAGQDDMGGSSANRLTDQSGGLNGDTLGATGGAETHTITEGQMPTHTHSGSVGSHTHTYRDRYFAEETFAASSATYRETFSAATGDANYNAKIGSGDTDTDNTTFLYFDDDTGSTQPSVTIGNAGSGTAHNNVQPTIVLNKIIFAGV